MSVPRGRRVGSGERKRRALSHTSPSQPFVSVETPASRTVRHFARPPKNSFEMAAAEVATPAEPVVAKAGPYAVPIEEGKTYYWCQCGLSKNQPFCDGSHKGTGLAPKAFTATESKTAYLCGCKQTENAPFCDGTHNKEKGIKAWNKTLLASNNALKARVAELEAQLAAKS
ncbi:iron-binding zinc finger CDGSH type-domain-containing protein [Hyaloraphidium curvatum]|nr:iron-binding zinc finger CDGSH type-domain-containing protein [Hyaloraphidium curvatum]